ncbi:MAG: HAD family hydrolase [Oscillospiraceae bacterium]|jgi:Cof subfamily protein (haloacid dehalogenase superfamily)|nr:HAD family hydrolase [Oscillospiraceae bacterium]
MDKTLYISDLDGTLLNSSAELSEYTTDRLNALLAGGMHFSVATARTLATAAKILAGLTLRLPIVLMNGVLIYDMEGQRCTQVNYLAPETVLSVIETLRQFEITGFMYEMRDGELTTYHESLEQKPLRDFVEERIARYHKDFRHTDGFDHISREHIIYFTLLDRRERLLPVRDALLSYSGLKLTMYEDNYRPGFWYLEIFSDKASKQSAVNYLREEYGYSWVVGFGDNLNDLPMFAACDVRVAVENAKPEVKAAADHICGGNDGDGVAKWLDAL